MAGMAFHTLAVTTVAAMIVAAMIMAAIIVAAMIVAAMTVAAIIVAAMTVAAITVAAMMINPKLRCYGFHLHTTFFSSTSLRHFCYASRMCKLWNALPKSCTSLSLSSFKFHVYNLDLVNLSKGHI